MSEMEDFDDHPLPVEGEALPALQPRWARTLAWVTIVLGGLYLLNPTFGVDILPDNVPVLGNLDEAAILLLVLGALRYLGIALPDFIERLIQPVPRLPSSIEHEDD
jgi:hypothetical protein